MTNQEALKNLISNKLDEQGLIHNVDFNTVLYNREEIKYYRINDSGQKERFVPSIINDVVGEYLNVPNANSTSNDTSIEFDIMVDYDSEYDSNTETEIEKVGYQNTLNAIEGFKNSLLARYFPLGTSYLYMGGEDSTFQFEFSSFSMKSLEFSFTPKNTDVENVLTFDNVLGANINKTATAIKFNYPTIINLEIPYTVNEDVTITLSYIDSLWTLTDGTNTDSGAVGTGLTIDTIKVGETTGLECIFRTLKIESTLIEQIVIEEWPSKTLITNTGESVISNDSISNCILWSDDGNAIFGFGTLSPTTGLRTIDDSFLYQAFELPISVFISNDVLFGNNFEYYLDGEQIYPIDRQITLATELGSGQYINGNENEHLVEESSREHTISFYYIPNKKLNSLLKHVVTGTVAQNTTYELVVQYPFFQVTYDVVLENGGTQPNINTLSTLTLTFKKKDRNLT